MYVGSSRASAPCRWRIKNMLAGGGGGAAQNRLHVVYVHISGGDRQTVGTALCKLAAAIRRNPCFCLTYLVRVEVLRFHLHRGGHVAEGVAGDDETGKSQIGSETVPVRLGGHQEKGGGRGMHSKTKHPQQKSPTRTYRARARYIHGRPNRPPREGSTITRDTAAVVPQSISQQNSMNFPHTWHIYHARHTSRLNLSRIYTHAHQEADSTST